MTVRVNRYINRLCLSTGQREPVAATAAFVSSHRKSNETLDVLAYRLGVHRIIEDQLPYEGGLFQLPGGELVIKLNSASPSPRKRFTLAHEIGHLLLGKPGLRSSCGEDRDLERACDAIAAELLMPVDETTTYVQSLGRPSPEKLRLIASKYFVSIHAAAVRVHSGLRLWKCFVGMWERHHQIKTEWFVGRRLWDRTEPDSSSLDLALSSPATVESKEYWYRGPAAQPIWLKLLRISDTRVLGLIGFVSHA